MFSLDEIKNYFGATIAIYFAFLEYYTFALVPLVLLVFFFSLINVDELWNNLIFALINVLWGTVFLEFWKRNCATLTHRWGTLKQSLGNCANAKGFIFCSFRSLLSTISFSYLQHCLSFFSFPAHLFVL